MAMALLDSGFPATRFHIDGIDISARALAHAKRAVYGRNSFRGQELAFRDRHFKATSHGYHVAEAVRRQVTLQQGNLFDADFLPGSEIYDVIFFRNILIYFDRATQDRAIHVLSRLLTPQGVLFVGSSESGVLLNHNFVTAKIPLAFAFRRASAALPASQPIQQPIPQRAPKHPATVVRDAPLVPAQSAPRSRRTLPTTLAAPAAPAIDVRPVLPMQSIGADANAGIEKVQRLADQGQLAEAEKYCEQHLCEHGPSAQAYYLLGLMRDAIGQQAQSIDYYRKALYLDPNHHEALIHLAFQLGQQGDAAGAHVLHQRALRLAQKKGK